ncbi:hypothetical protein CK203_105727 [Vitis vinifera]|uniref:Uncharacterized protein n=1 Tax=Vitis vinifera TaxID=29760 RepID=A0A438FKB6_VITVI|nr:hypothetical protein CK203_105727 [Vitis vinifera]
MLSGSLTKVSKSYYVILTACLPQPTFRHLQSERTGMMASHLPRSLTAACRVMMALPPPRGIIRSQKVFPPLKREVELLSLYIWTFTQGGSYVDHRDARPQHWRRLWESLIQSPAKMATPSRSLSSAREEEDNSEWRQAIERRPLASERQMQALLQKTTRLREENVVSRIQASSTGPPRRQCSRGQVSNSRPVSESIYLGTAGAILKHVTLDHMSDTRPCTKLPMRKAQTLLISQQKDNATKNPSCQTQCARG